MQRPVKGARRVTRLALLTAIALTIFLVEAQIPVAIGEIAVSQCFTPVIYLLFRWVFRRVGGTKLA